MYMHSMDNASHRLSELLLHNDTAARPASGSGALSLDGSYCMSECNKDSSKAV